MGRAALLILLGLAPLHAVAAGVVPLRVLDAPVDAEPVAFRRHLDLGVELGFNAVLLRTTLPDADGSDSVLRERLVDARERGLRVLVEVEPGTDPDEPLRFLDEAPRRRLLAAFGPWRELGVHDWIVSLRGAPLRLTELEELMRYGRLAAPAHVDYVAAIAEALPLGDRVWFRPPVDNDALLTNRRIHYVPSLLRSLPRLPREVGIVWTGPDRWSRAISAGEVQRAVVRFGGRPLLLEDRYPESGRSAATALAVNLGPLRQRDPAIAPLLAGYVACPAPELDASRLALRTIAGFLADPEGYDADRAAARAIDAAAGDDARAHEALRTQAVEWGGWIGEPNYRALATESPAGVAASLQDPAIAASWVWVRRRYPERIEALAGLSDGAFRDGLVRIMRRRLAVARAVPLVRELRARAGAGRDDLDELMGRLRAEREHWRSWPDAREALDRFLVAAGIGVGPGVSR